LLKKKILKSKIEKLFKDLKILRNDNVIIHSNSAGINQFLNDKNDTNLKLFIQIMLNYIGKNGTVLIPTYNYDFTKGKTFQVDKSLSQVGELGNILIKSNSKNRTREPVFSHIAFGKLKDKIFNCDTKEAFGDKSIFNYILNKNFKIICFCCSPATMTFIHFVEKKVNVDYRYNKYFKSFIKINDRKIITKYKYCVGKKNIDYSLKEKKIYNLLGKKLIIKNFGRFICSQINTKLLFKTIKNKISKDKHFLINNENKF
jgi:aminoglycoside 3-N-acetyltransferase